MTSQLTAARLIDKNVHLTWVSGGPELVVSLFWLRDNCQEVTSQHPDTKQRLVDTFNISPAISALVKIENNGQQLAVEWSNNDPVSHFDSQFLAALRSNPEILPNIRTLWDCGISNAVPEVAYAEFLNNDAALKDLLEKVQRFGLCFIEGVPGTPEATKAIATRISYIRETIFGGYWDFTANMEHKDTAYTSMAIGPHTDGTYSFDAPGYQMFHCLAAECTGGENVLIDGFKMAEILRRDQPALYKVLTEVAIPAQYLDYDRGIHLMARRPLLRLDDSGELVQVTYNNYDRAPFVLPPEQHALLYQALNAFNALCHDPALHYRRRLLPGSVLLFDNWRVLHARDAYVGYRQLAGVYLNKEDVESRLRYLRIRASEAT